MTEPRDPANPILRGRNRPTHPDRAKSLLFAKQVLQMRIAGFTFQAIGEQLGGKTKGSVFKAYMRGLTETRAELEKDASELRALELARLDAMLSSLSPKVAKGDEKAIDRAIKIGERRAKLLGLDAPTKIAPTTPDGTQPAAIIGGGFSDQQKLDRVLELVQRGLARKAGK